MRVGFAEFQTNQNSVPSILYCIDMSIFSYGASQFTNKEIIGSSGLLSTLSNINNKYAIIKNKYNFIGNF